MKMIKRIYHFIGSINCAIILLATTALLVIIGTFIESHTDSHRNAANYIYSSPLFALLLWGFFLNILISALRRWPFKFKHIPFLITHFGLLMVIGGCLIKNYYGIQGHMTLVEGSGSHQMIVPDSYSVIVEKKDEAHPKRLIAQEYTLTHHPFQKQYKLIPANKLTLPFRHLSLNLVDISEHSKESWKSWFKGDFAYIHGLPPLSIRQAEGIPTSSGRAKLSPLEEVPWTLYALKGEEATATLHTIFLEKTEAVLKNQLDGTVIARRPLKSLVGEEILVDTLKISAEFSQDLFHGTPEITFTLANVNSPYSQNLSISLSGERALENRHAPYTVPGIPPLAIEISRDPALALVEDREKTVTLMAINSFGQVYIEKFPEGRMRSIIVYDDGFGGYSIQTKIPFAANFPSRTILEKAKFNQLTGFLQSDLPQNRELSPPLELFKRACEKTRSDLSNTFVEFFSIWHNSHQWLANGPLPFSDSLKHTLENLEWNSLSPEISQYCLLSTKIIPDVEVKMAKGADLWAALKEIRWPLIARLQEGYQQAQKVASAEIEPLFHKLTQQIMYIAAQWPDVHTTVEPSAATDAAMLSAYLRLYEIDPESLLPAWNKEEKEAALQQIKNSAPIPICLECGIMPEVESLPANTKLEENLPKITLIASEKGTNQMISLTYDRSGTGLKWPLLRGEYRTRFQPHIIELPYHLRLRNAHQKNYANTQRPQSYNCSLLITNRQTGKVEACEISMNNVYESPEGYRFYLSNITPADESQAKKIQLAVNYDPAKYLLTYPGGLIVALGIGLLFWMRPYRK